MTSAVTDSGSDDSFHSACDLDTSVIDKLVNYKNNFNVCHINAQSVPAHYSDLLCTFPSTGVVDAILVSESWLKPSLPSTSYSLPGYILIRNDRVGCRGGGVAIYLRSELQYKVICLSPCQYSASPEFLFIEVIFCGAKLLLGVVYCPPVINYFSKLETVLEEVLCDYSHHILMGDFNTCLVNDSSVTASRAVKLKNIISSVNLFLLPTGPTHHLPTSDSLLDLMFTSRFDLISTHGQLLAPYFSHHDLLYASYKLKPPKFKPPTVFMRHFKNIDMDAMGRDISNIDWSPLLNAQSIDVKVDIFNKEVLRVFDDHAPLRRTKIKRPPAPWITDVIRQSMRRRNRAYRIYIRNRCEVNAAAYKVARNRCNQMCRIAKRNFFYEVFKNNSSSDNWKFLNSLGVGRSRVVNGTGDISLEDLNKHFASNPRICDDTKFLTLMEINSIPLPESETFCFSAVSEVIVLKALKSVTSNAVGVDGIGRTMIFKFIDHFLPTICHIIDFSFSTGQFPRLWRCAHIIPIPKITHPSLPTHYRPISILPFLSKVIEYIAFKQFLHFLNLYTFLNPLQSGFRSGHSTTSALLKVTEDIRNGMDKTKITVLVLIDFTNAFNAVDPDLLVATLSRYNLSSVTLEWFSQYLHGRRQRIRVNQLFSEWCDLTTGVPQGGILSPLLFSIFINSISSSLLCHYHLYADDLQIYVHTDVGSIREAISMLNSDLAQIHSWSKRYGVAVNPNKCQSIIIGGEKLSSRLDLSSLGTIQYDGSVIPFSAAVKDLGVVLDTNLGWSSQLTEISRKVFSSLHQLNKLKNFLPVRAKLILVYSLLLPIIDYGDSCCVNMNEAQLDKLERILNSCIRFIFCLRKYDHISTYRNKLKWLNIRSRRNLRILCLLFGILNEPNTPIYLKDMFKFLSDQHDRPLRSSHNLSLSIPSHSTSFFSKSFAVVAVSLWNSLPLSIRTAPNRSTFKKGVYSHLFKQQT